MYNTNTHIIISMHHYNGFASVIKNYLAVIPYTDNNYISLQLCRIFIIASIQASILYKIKSILSFIVYKINIQ